MRRRPAHRARLLRQSQAAAARVRVRLHTTRQTETRSPPPASRAQMLLISWRRCSVGCADADGTGMSLFCASNCVPQLRRRVQRGVRCSAALSFGPARDRTCLHAVHVLRGHHSACGTVRADAARELGQNRRLAGRVATTLTVRARYGWVWCVVALYVLG